MKTIAEKIEKHMLTDEAIMMAASDRRNNMTYGEVEEARVYGFILMHMGNEDSPLAWESQKAERRLAEAMRAAEPWERNHMMSDFTAAWLSARGIEWGGIEILGDAQLIEHGAEGHYHYAFRALVTR